MPVACCSINRAYIFFLLKRCRFANKFFHFNKILGDDNGLFIQINGVL